MPPQTGYARLLAFSLGMVFLSVSLIDSVSERKSTQLSDRARVNYRFFCGVLFLLLGYLCRSMSSMVFLGCIGALCLSQVVFDMFMAPEEDMEHYDEYLSQQVDRSEHVVASSNLPKRLDIGTAIRKGLPSELKQDLYFFLYGKQLAQDFYQFCISIFIGKRGFCSALPD